MSSFIKKSNVIVKKEAAMCFCGDQPKEIISKKNGAKYLVCPNSRYVNGEYKNECDFFLNPQNLTGPKCACDLPTVQFQTKKGQQVSVCIYKNAPAAFKKQFNYNCNKFEIQ